MMCCCRKLLRNKVFAWIFLNYFTISVAISLAYLCATYSPQTVLIACILTFELYVLLFITAIVIDMKKLWFLPPILYGIQIGILTIIFCFVLTTRWWYNLFNFLYLIITCIYTMFHINTVMSKYGISEKDYVIAAVILYIDLIIIFIYILSLFGKRK